VGLVTGGAVSPVIPPAVAGQTHGRAGPRPRRQGPLPVPRLSALRARSTVYGFAAVDGRGRIADGAVVRAMGWVAGTRLDIRESAGVVLVSHGRQGVFALTGQGHLRLPAAVRRWCGLAAGDRVLLAAEPAQGLLVVHPPAALDAMITQFHAVVLGGDGQ
jgi:hypothetical protein